MSPVARLSGLAHRTRLFESLLESMLAADHPAALKVVDEAMKLGWTADDLRLQLITPVLYEVGRRWERGELNVADEHLATSVAQWLLFTIAGGVQRPARTGRRAVVGCSEGELHSVGSLIVGHVLAERGWTVLYLGASTPATAWEQIVRARRPDVAVLSTTTRGLLDQVGAAVHAAKSAHAECVTVIGGQAYAESSGEAADFGADLLLTDLRALPDTLT
jgi:methanogenic corrinoid protein MtbC1